MAKYGKWLGAGLGFILGTGPIGVLIGFSIGQIIDKANYTNANGYTDEDPHLRTGNFAVSLLVLIASVLKADGKVSQTEIDYVNAFLSKNFQHQSTKEAMKILNELLKQEIPIEGACLEVKTDLNYSSRLELIHLLYGIFHCKPQANDRTVRVINKISYKLGISASDHRSIRNKHKKSDTSAYTTLGVNTGSSDEEIKKSYRKLATQCHPDKVNHLSEDEKKHSEQKFRDLNEAYEKIKKERGLK